MARAFGVGWSAQAVADLVEHEPASDRYDESQEKA
jgi:hypothetical protein